ncbi:hypothetical protein GYMLUDRAFT_44152 [Collybiopsis luxurians FD-317 M1]|uniref:Uncharacterized protein n=1 Tax=Collybiopsis luxurians FD-317 M1 TaxID=944289 RepID=A0A0D0CB57_9AGAR|nr:hypothetical protein GYMLUDRAFT_44152 [Collybiopsis luxurians FD-317 M1]
MGNATSKAARKLPRRADPSSWAESGSTASGMLPKTPLAREVKDQAIQDDTRDPHFMSNLSRLGAVNVDYNVNAVRPQHRKTRDGMKTLSLHREMIETRIQSEQEASSMHPSRNHIQASTLTYLLDQSKSNISRRELAELTDKYGMDIEKLEKLSQRITSPSINPDSVVRKVQNEDGEEELSVMAIWAESLAFKK